MAAVPPPYVPYVAPPRVANHLQPLAILWFVFGVLRLMSGLMAVLALHSLRTGLFSIDDMPPFMPHLFGILGPMVAVGAGTMGLTSLFVGWSLIQRKPWARTLAMIVGIIELLKIPLGTGLGIYTLWVLAPAQSGVEWQGLQRAERYDTP